ncbi:MAG: VWA domain-containing protein [Chloroflexi bacterium]|nr:VWA domain-containing protein [Chloroflexota bacterium]
MSQEAVLDIKLNNDKVLSSSEDKMLYLLADLKPGDIPGESAGINLAVVLDKSGSMYQARKLEFVIKAVEHLINNAGPNDIISIIFFADKARVVVSASSPVDKETALRKLSNLDEVDIGSGTQMLRGIEAALGELRKFQGSGRLSRVVLLTDGLTLHETESLNRCRQAAAEGIGFSTIGVGEDFNEQFLIGLADDCSGRSHYIEDPSKIPDILNQEVEGFHNAVITNAVLEIEFEEGVSPRKGYKVKPMIYHFGEIKTTDNKAEFKLGDVRKDEGASVLTELILHSGSPSEKKLATVRVCFDIPSLKKENVVVESPVTVTYTENESEIGCQDPDVLAVVDSVSIFHQQTRALDLIKDGQRARGTQMLTNAMERLAKRGDDELAGVVKEEIQRIEKGLQTTPLGTKRITYGTRKLTPRAK